MNQRIKDMFVRSGGVIEVCDVTRDEILTYTDNLDIEKFAELIIYDCMSICETNGGSGKDGHYCSDDIKKRFGVK